MEDCFLFVCSFVLLLSRNTSWLELVLFLDHIRRHISVSLLVSFQLISDEKGYFDYNPGKHNSSPPPYVAERR